MDLNIDTSLTIDYEPKKILSVQEKIVKYKNKIKGSETFKISSSKKN